MIKDKTSILNNYKPAVDDELNKIHEIKSFAGKTDRHGKFTVYTDGSANGASETKDKKSFAGWGFYFKDQFPNGRKTDGTKYGSLFNADPEESELKAVLESLKFNNHPSHFEIISDCSSVVLGLRDIHEKISDYHHANSKSKKEKLSPKESKSFNYLKIWKDIYDEIYQNDNIVSLKVRWVRSHVLSKNEVKSPPNPYDFSAGPERAMVEDIIGNNRADQAANLGCIKSIRSALFFYKNIHLSESELKRSMETCKKNFSNGFSSDEAIRFLSQQPDDFLPEDIYKSIIPKSVRITISEIKEKSSNPNDLIENISKRISSEKIKDFSRASQCAAERFKSKFGNHKNSSPEM